MPNIESMLFPKNSIDEDCFEKRLEKRNISFIKNKSKDNFIQYIIKFSEKQKNCVADIVFETTANPPLKTFEFIIPSSYQFIIKNYLDEKEIPYNFRFCKKNSIFYIEADIYKTNLLISHLKHYNLIQINSK
jgi:hypothetical protein